MTVRNTGNISSCNMWANCVTICRGSSCMWWRWLSDSVVWRHQVTVVQPRSLIFSATCCFLTSSPSQSFASRSSLQQFRKSLRVSDGIYTTKEFHAAKFTSGRGRLGRKGKGVSQQRRCGLFNETLEFIATFPDIHLLNAFRTGGHSEKLPLLERLLNRTHTAVQNWGSTAVLMFDEGDSRKITRLSRKLSVFNPIKSKFGSWPDGKEFKNFPLAGFLEDPVFRISRTSSFIQSADFCAYALFQKEKPTPSRAQFGLNQSVESKLGELCVLAANPQDRFGIIR